MPDAVLHLVAELLLEHAFREKSEKMRDAARTQRKASGARFKICVGLHDPELVGENAVAWRAGTLATSQTAYRVITVCPLLVTGKRAAPSAWLLGGPSWLARRGR